MNSYRMFAQKNGTHTHTLIHVHSQEERIYGKEEKDRKENENPRNSFQKK